ncbi:MAG: DUF624 domain-containing protein [Clostridia bacterium]|nr:DUF624 domain-containing protein [Clostridia bacterium]
MEKQKKPFLSFMWNREREDLLEVEDTTPNLKYFFKLFGRRFPRILTLNLMMLAQILPILVAILVYMWSDTTPTQTSNLFAPLWGVSQISSAPSVSVWLSTLNIQTFVPIQTLPNIIAYVILFAVTAVTWGWQQVGAAYNLRSMVRREPVYLWSDFFYAIKRNLKQALIVGLLDFLFLFLLVFDYLYFYMITGSFAVDFMFFIIFALIILYSVMRFYLYLLLITFDLKTLKLFKNALIFSVLGIKRNLMAALGIVLVIGINLLLILGGLSIGLATPLILPLFYLLGVSGFITTYAAYPVIQKYMIDPYTDNNDDNGNNSDADEGKIISDDI